MLVHQRVIFHSYANCYYYPHDITMISESKTTSSRELEEIYPRQVQTGELEIRGAVGGPSGFDFTQMMVIRGEKGSGYFLWITLW